ncbi:hypothetical protein [Tepidibacillus marianensis]|uniref:hypothetical protein n=1 Tax=Tepidibacillus marianensis TaxID=3131995 RepID=UPI0030D053E6
MKIKKVVKLNSPEDSKVFLGTIKIYLDKRYIGTVPLQIEKDKETLSDTIKSVWRRVWKGD